MTRPGSTASKVAAAATLLATSASISYADEPTPPQPPLSLIHFNTDTDIPSDNSDPSEHFIDETITVRASEKVTLIGNSNITAAPQTQSARTPSELQKALPQTLPYRMMIRVQGVGAHSSRASKDGNGIYNAFLVAQDIKSEIKQVASQGGSFGIHVLKGANNITPSDVVLVIDCPNQATYDAVSAAYIRSRAENGDSVKTYTLNLARKESENSKARETSSLCVEYSIETPEPQQTNAKEEHTIVSISNPLPSLNYKGPTYLKKVNLLDSLVSNKIVSTDPNVSSGEHINAAKLFDTLQNELKEYPHALDAMRTYRFRVTTGKDAEGNPTYVDNFLVTFGNLTKNARKIVTFDHLDVVPAQNPEQHQLKVTKDALIGRGTDDMYRTVIADLYGVINFYKFADTLPEDARNNLLDNFCIVLGYDAAEELGGPHTVDFMSAIAERLPDIRHNSVCFGEVRGFLEPVPSTIDDEQRYMMGTIYSEKGGGSIRITLRSQKDTCGHIIPESIDRELEVMGLIRNYQDSFPTIVNEPLFRNGLEVYSAHVDIRNIMTQYLQDQPTDFKFIPSDTLNTSLENALGVPKKIFDQYASLFEALNTLGIAAVEQVSNDALLDIFSKQDVLEEMGDFFLEQSKKYNPNSMFSQIYGAMVRSVFTCNLMSSNTDGTHTLNSTIRVLNGHSFRDIQLDIEKRLKHIYGDRFKEDVQIASTLFREGSSTPVDTTELVSETQSHAELVGNIVLEMFHTASSTSGDTPDIAKKVAYSHKKRVIAKPVPAHFGTTKGYSEKLLPTIAVGTNTQRSHQMMDVREGFHAYFEQMPHHALAGESIGQFLLLLKLAGLEDQHLHKAVAFAFDEYIGNQEPSPLQASTESSKVAP